MNSCSCSPDRIGVENSLKPGESLRFHVTVLFPCYNICAWQDKGRRTAIAKNISGNDVTRATMTYERTPQLCGQVEDGCLIHSWE